MSETKKYVVLSELPPEVSIREEVDAGGPIEALAKVAGTLAQLPEAHGIALWGTYPAEEGPGDLGLEGAN